ncbi:MAG: aldehyde dehydrogenase family protein [Nitrosopumilaceae archaeon]|nr:aldehyde dehydrogenase family protein [Nitrosopumilaceae archaeon]
MVSNNKEDQNKILSRISFGGGCINDCVMHVSNSNLPFGGVGSSGMGSYHGKFSFETFSHKKSVLKNTFWFDLKLRYAPYNDKRIKLARWFLEK